MVQVVMNADQAKLLAESTGSVEIVDASGNRLGTVVRPPSIEDVKAAKQSIEKNDVRYSTDEVVSHLRSLEQR